MNPRYSVIIPIYNESAYLDKCLNKIIKTKVAGWQQEIIAVDDGSKDDSLELLNSFNRKNKIKIISMGKNYGKGRALIEGIKVATGEILIIQDADLEYDPEDYRRIIPKYEDRQVEVVYGSRVMGTKLFGCKSGAWPFLAGGMTLTKLVNLAFGTEITDQPTCYKSWRADLSKGLLATCHGNGFEFEVEMTAYFSKLCKITEVPIHYYPRTVNQGKKIRFSDFLKSAWLVFRTYLTANLLAH